MNDKQQLAAMGEHMREMEECKPEFKVPDGWKLVPVEPTYGMAICGEEAWWGGETDSESIIMGYRAMLAAAPEYKP